MYPLRLCFFVLILVTCATHLLVGQTVAFVDMDELLENVQGYTNTVDELDRQVETYETKLEDMQRSIDSAYRKLEVETFLLTDLAIENRKRQIQKMEQQRSELKKTYFGGEGFLVNTRKKIVEPYLDKAVKAVQDYAIENKIDIIFDTKKQNNIIFASPALDITKEVIKRLSSN